MGLPELGLASLKAKVDTGARTSSLHVAAIRTLGDLGDGEAELEIDLAPDRRRPERLVTARVQQLARIRVTDSGGNSELRPVIETTLVLGPVEKRIRLTLADRSTMLFRMILGRKALEGDFLVDVSKKYLHRGRRRARTPGALTSASEEKEPPDPCPRSPSSPATRTSTPPPAWSRRSRTAAATVQVIDPLHCVVNLSKKRPEIDYHGKVVRDVDGVIPRIGASITFYGLAVLRQFEMMGVFSANESQAVARSRDKLRSLQLFSRRDIGIPPTAFARRREDLRDAIKRVGGTPVVLKLLEGHPGGRRDPGRVASAPPSRCSTPCTRSSRTSSSRRSSRRPRARTSGRSWSATGWSRPCAGRPPRGSSARTSTAAALPRASSSTRSTSAPPSRRPTSLGLNIAGVDLMPSNEGPMVLEVNSSPGLKGVETATGIDVAGAMVDFVIEHLGDPPPRRRGPRVDDALGELRFGGREIAPGRVGRDPPRGQRALHRRSPLRAGDRDPRRRARARPSSSPPRSTATSSTASPSSATC